MQYRLFPWAAALVVTLGACGDPTVDRPDSGSFLPDGGSSDPPPAPRLDMVYTPVPWPVTTLRGRADMARRVIVEGGGNPISSAVLPTGEFCVDVPMPMPDTYELRVLAQNSAGQLSEMAATSSVVFDPAAPPVSGATTCSGTDPAGCGDRSEICDNGIDDDCNGLRDLNDPDCATCDDDVLEPNDDTGAPRVEPDRFDGLQICPGNPDFYGIYLRRGDTLLVRLFFTDADGDIDMQLLAPDRETSLARATSVTDDEMIEHTATAEGPHVIRVYGLGDAQNAYSMDVQVDRAM